MAKAAAGYGLGLAIFALVAAMAGAAQFKVGEESGWSVPGANAESYNTWAMKKRFQIGDALVFVYPKDKDAVLLVDPPSYNACNTTSYVTRFADGNTVFTFDRSGAFFFISGVEANCRANEKLIVMVLAGRNGTRAGAGAPPPSFSSLPLAPPPASTTPPPSSTSSPPPATPPPAPAPKAPSPTSVPPPASAPATPTSPPPASSPPAPPSSSPPAPASPPSSPAGAPPSANAPNTAGGSTNSTGTSSSPPPAGSNDRNGAGVTAAAGAGLAGSAAACVIGYAMLAL